LIEPTDSISTSLGDGYSYCGLRKLVLFDNTNQKVIDF